MMMSRTVKQRINLERKICRAVIKNLLAAGYAVEVYDGEETALKQSTDFKAICKAIMSTDEDYLIVYHAMQRIGWVRLVYGNSGWDVICDYTTNLEPQIEPTNEMCDKAMKATI